MTECQEVWLYLFDSLVSEFDGALGLFLGFSFLGLHDIIESVFNNLVGKLVEDGARTVFVWIIPTYFLTGYVLAVFQNSCWMTLVWHINRAAS